MESSPQRISIIDYHNLISRVQKYHFNSDGWQIREVIGRFDNNTGGYSAIRILSGLEEKFVDFSDGEKNKLALVDAIDLWLKTKEPDEIPLFDREDPVLYRDPEGELETIKTFVYCIDPGEDIRYIIEHPQGKDRSEFIGFGGVSGKSLPLGKMYLSVASDCISHNR